MGPLLPWQPLFYFVRVSPISVMLIGLLLPWQPLFYFFSCFSYFSDAHWTVVPTHVPVQRQPLQQHRQHHPHHRHPGLNLCNGELN